ncbi:MAG: LEA type 2 family protein [Spirochaetia bacterium]|nr:LEA type 2 family protein [Spirochaetia bacterium]
MLNKKIVWIALGLFFGSCASSDMKISTLAEGLGKAAEKLPKPTATIEKFDIKKISLRDITFTFDIAINNPYSVAINLDAVELDFSAEKNKLFHTATSKGFKVAAKGKAVSSFDVTLTYESIIKLVQDYNSHDYLACDIDVMVIIPIPKTISNAPESVKLNFKLSQKIPAIKPKISIAGFNVIPPSQKDIEDAIKKSVVSAGKNVDPLKAVNMFRSLIQGKPVEKPEIKPEDLDLKFKVNFDIILENQARAPLKFNSLEFYFIVNSDQLVNGNTTVVSKNETTSILHIVNEFSSKNLTKAVINAFKDGRGSFTLKGNTSLHLPPEILKHPLLLDFKEDGNFNLR